ncbi:MAG: RDD family protein [Candidatus Omnitrophica bacterium]|nr:RDD family protein [Candidatus Omnitrophota bacterium]
MDFHKPGPNKRVCAFLIDSVIGQILGVMFALIGIIKIDYFVWAAYILFKDIYNGQGVGKRLVNIQVVDSDGVSAKPSKTILRNIFMVIPVFPVIEYCIMLRDKESGRRLGDKTAKTRVNDLKHEAKDITYLWISLAIVAIIIAFSVWSGLTTEIAKN